MKNLTHQSENKEKKKMHVALKITLVSLAVIVGLLLVFASYFLITNWRTITAVYRGLTDSAENIVADRIKIDEHQNVTFEKTVGVKLPQEFKDKFSSGEMTEDEITQAIIDLGVIDVSKPTQPSLESQTTNVQDDKPTDKNDSVASVDSVPTNDRYQVSNDSQDVQNVQSVQGTQGVQNDKPTPPPSAQTQTPVAEDKKQPAESTDTPKQETVSSVDPRVARLVARMYVLKSQYTTSVEEIVNSMKAEYAKLPKEQQTSATKTSIASSYMNKISALEAQCDAQVNNVITELRAVLKETGGDIALADEILKAYDSEKEITKAYYVNKYS